MGSLNKIIIIVSLLLNVNCAKINNPTADESEPAVWHSYIFDTGAGNREDLSFSKIQLEHFNISLRKNVSNWAALKIHTKTLIVGYEGSNLVLINYVNDVEYNSYESELSGKASHVTLFQSWNATSFQMEGYSVVAVEYNNETWLNWYRINENGVSYLWNWPVHRKITHLEVIRLNDELKLLMVTHGLFDDTNPVAEMYGFLLENNFDLWLISRILFNEVPTSTAICLDGDYVYLSVSLSKAGLVQVFKHSILNPSEKYFSHHQEIISTGVNSLTSFRISFRWYLGIAGTLSKVYRFNGNGELILVTRFDFGFSEYLKVIPVNTYRQDVIIFAKTKSDALVISGTGDGEFKAQRNFTTLICNEDEECLQKLNRVSLQNSASFFMDDNQIIFFSDFNQPAILKFSVRLQPLSDSIANELNEVLAEKKRLEELFYQQSLKIEKLKNLTKSLLNENNEVEIKSKWVVQNLTTDKIEYESLNNVNVRNVELGKNKNWSKEDFSIDVDDLKSKMDILRMKIKEIKFNVIASEVESNELSTDDLTEFISGGFIANGPVYVDDLEVEEINDEKVTDVFNDLFRLDQPKKIYGEKTISNLVANEVFFEKLNKVSASEIVYTDKGYENDEEHVINGDLVYENDLFVTGNVTLLAGGSVNNLRLETDVVRSNVMFNRSTVKFENVKVEEEANIRNLNKKPLILPVHITPFDIHTLDSVNQARIERVNVKNNLNVSFINDRNFTELMEKLIFKNENSVKKFPIIKLNGTFLASDLEIDYLNGLKYPEDFILASTEGPIQITGVKEFLGDLIVDNVNVGANDIGVPFANVMKSIGVKDSSKKFYDNLKIDGVLFVDTINGHPWDYFESIVRKNESRPVFTGLKNFKDSVKVNDVKLYGTLNGKNLDNILTKDTEQIINSNQIFRSVIFKNLTLGNTFDGVCVKCLNNSVVRISQDGIYRSSFIFNDSNCVANEFNILETLKDELAAEDLKFENNTLILNGNTNFSKIKTKIMKINGSMNTFDKINNVNLTNLEHRRVSRTRSQVFHHDIYYNDLTLRGNVSVLAVNNKDILSDHEPETEKKNIINKLFDGDITFSTITVKGKIYTNDNVNNFNLTSLKEYAVNIIKGDTVSGLTAFEDPVYFKELNLTGRLGGFYLKKLKRDTVRKNQPVFLRGVKNFVNGLNVTKSLRIRTLNGHLIPDIATVQGDHIMNNTVLVNGNVIVRKNLTLHGSINDLAVHDLLRKFSTELNSFFIPGDATFTGKNNTIRILTVGGMINNVDLDYFMNSLIWKDKDFRIGGNKTFLNEVCFDGNLTVKNTINELNFTAFSKDIVMKNKRAKIKGGVVLSRAIVKNLNVKHDLNSTLLNGKDTSEWVDESIPLNKDIFISGKKSFRHVSSNKKISADFINGHTPETMITLESDQYIPEFVQFSKIHVKSNVPVEGKVNGKNLKEEWENTVLVSGNQIVNGEVTFKEDLVIDGDASIPSANGVILENLTTLHTDQVIKTVLRFEGPVVVNNNLEKSKIVNGIDIEEWERNAVLLNREQTIDGVWNIHGNVTALKSFEGDALLNNISIPVLVKKIDKAKFLASQKEDNLEIEYQMQCEALKNVSGELVQQPYLFRQFDLMQILDSYFISRRAQFDLLIESVITFEANKNHYLILTFVDECNGELYRWDRSDSQYVYLKQVRFGPVHKWLAVNYNETTYLITTSKLNEAVLCDDDLQPANIWSFDDEEKYGHIFATDAFSDIIQSKNASHVFYTIRENGFIYEWTLKEKSLLEKFLKNMGRGYFKFVDFGFAAGGLSVANSKEFRRFDLPDTELSTGSTIPAVYDGEVVSLSVGGKIFTAVAYKDQIVIYDNIVEGRVVTSIHSRKPKSLLWFDFGNGKEIFLIFQSRGRILEVFEYKGIAGFKRKMSFHLPSRNLQSVVLPDQYGYESLKYLIVVLKKKMYLLKARMLGHIYTENGVDC